MLEFLISVFINNFSLHLIHLQHLQLFLVFRACNNLRRDSNYRREAMYRLLPLMPEANRYNLAYLIKFLQLILDYEEYTK